MIDTHVECDGLHRQYDWSNITPSVAVLESIAFFEHGNRNRVTSVLDSPLYQYIKPEALNKLVKRDTPLRIEFIVSAYHVHISGNTVCVSSAGNTHSLTQ